MREPAFHDEAKAQLCRMGDIEGDRPANSIQAARKAVRWVESAWKIQSLPSSVLPASPRAYASAPSGGPT